MKAVEFVKKFGLGKAKGIVAVMMDGVVNYNGESISYSDLKQIVEAWKLVENQGGLISSKKYLKFLQASVDIGLYHGLDNVNCETEIPLLRDAIACVEQC